MLKSDPGSVWLICIGKYCASVDIWYVSDIDATLILKCPCFTMLGNSLDSELWGWNPSQVQCQMRNICHMILLDDLLTRDYIIVTEWFNLYLRRIHQYFNKYSPLGLPCLSIFSQTSMFVIFHRFCIIIVNVVFKRRIFSCN